MSSLWHSTNWRSNIKNPTTDRRFRMSKIRHSTDWRSNVKNPTSGRTRFGCPIFDIRLCGRSNRKNPNQQWGESNRICYIRSDRIHTPNTHILKLQEYFSIVFITNFFSYTFLLEINFIWICFIYISKIYLFSFLLCIIYSISRNISHFLRCIVFVTFYIYNYLFITNIIVFNKRKKYLSNPSYYIFYLPDNLINRDTV